MIIGDKVKRYAGVLLLLSVSALGQSKEKPSCEGPVHAYACSAPRVTVSQLSEAEQKAIVEADQAVAVAEASAQLVRNQIVQKHGGFVAPDCGAVSADILAGGCMMETGSRLSDEAEWKDGWLILTKKWIPEL